MVLLDLAMWLPIYGGAIIAIGFSFTVSTLITAWFREQELKIQLGQLTQENALKKTTTMLTLAAIVLVFFLIVIGGAYTLILLSNASPSPSGNITNICENCSYPITNIVNNYNVSITVTCEKIKNHSVSVEELKYLMQKNR
jgi:hypothetical protein